MRYILLAIAFALSACAEEKVLETAESRANLFVASILNQSAQTFWDSLDEPSQQALAKLAGGSATDQEVVQKAFALIGRWRSLVSLKPIKSKASPTDLQTTITIEALSGEKMELSLNKKGDRWYVHLPIEQITASPSSKPSSVAATTPTSAATTAPSSTPASTSSPANPQ